MKDVVFFLEHIYEINDNEEIKHIGVFSSYNKAIEAINFLKNKPGFKDHPLDCFKVSEAIIDNFEWKEGFISWEDAMKQ